MQDTQISLSMHPQGVAESRSYADSTLHCGVMLTTAAACIRPVEVTWPANRQWHLLLWDLHQAVYKSSATLAAAGHKCLQVLPVGQVTVSPSELLLNTSRAACLLQQLFEVPLPRRPSMWARRQFTTKFESLPIKSAVCML